VRASRRGRFVNGRLEIKLVDCVFGDALKNPTSSATGPLLSALAAASLLLVHPWAQAFSLGRLTVQSYLGDPLRAEVEVVGLTPEEATTLRTGLASSEAFRAAGVDLNGSLAGLQASLQRRSDGRPVIRLVGERSVSEPFVDVILDFSWSTGRLQRAYTLLIDPPPVRASDAPQAAPVATAPVLSAPVAAASPQPQQPARVTPPSAPVLAPRDPVRKPIEPRPAPETRRGSIDSSYLVRSGDTLSLIAGAHAQPGVSLDQMLVSLYRGNPDAFLNNNMNRLKAGVLLSLPDGASASGVSPEEARQVIQAQSADFAAFRQRLAQGAPQVKSAETPRQSGGKVEAAIEDKRGGSAAAKPDQLTLSRAGAKSAVPESKLSKEAERKAAETRVAELSRNVAELKSLSKVTAAPAAPSAPEPALKGPQVPVPSPVALAPVPLAASAVPASSVPPVVAAASAVGLPTSASGETLAAASAPKAANSASAPKLPAAPAPKSEPSFFDDLLDNPFVLPGVVTLVALLAGLGVMRLRRRGSDRGSETSFVESKLQPDSFFGVSGGQRVDTREEGGNSSSSSSLSYSLSQLDAIGDVDPVAEADVYLAYGRDLQAEEILKEALRSDPGRVAIRTKLLEVYAKRADAKAVEAQARQILEMTGGLGDDWLKAQEFGRQVDPDNSLYVASGPIEEVDIDTSSDAPADLRAPLDELDESDVPTVPPPMTSSAPLDIDIDFDLDAPSSEAEPPAMAMHSPEVGSIDFDSEPTTESPATRDLRPTSPSLEFDLSDSSGRIEPTIAQAPPAAAVEFDFGDLSLDLDTPPELSNVLPDISEEEPMSFELANEISDPMERKLELADEFRRIGDIEGARDLLEEVLSRGDTALRARAQTLLSELG
jgi:pilus assembly protein FimV